MTAGAATQVITALSTLPSWPSPVTEFCNNGANPCASDGTTTTAGTDYIFFSLNNTTAGGCTGGAGTGCVLSYNVSNPAAVVVSGTGLNVTTTGTNGCWATGGLVIDNSDTTTAGASQIYFINLNGAAAGGPGSVANSGCTAGSATINATQAAQASP